MKPEENPYLQNTEQIQEYAGIFREHSTIDPELYIKYDIKRGLRDRKGTGVMAGLTQIGEVSGYVVQEGDKVAVPGNLYYRGINVRDLVRGFYGEKRFGYEETVYLLLFGTLPTIEQLKDFKELLAFYRVLPKNFVRDVSLKSPATDVMNTLARGVLALYPYDDKAEDTSLVNVMRQSLHLISRVPLLSIYGYQAYRYYYHQDSLYIHAPNPDLSLAEDFLSILRPNQEYTELEARILDMSMVLHAEHGGGNNSTFTTHVVSSTGTDTYSAIAAGLASLKGPKHGGANIKVKRMFEDIKSHVTHWGSDEELEDYLRKLAAREAFDKSGLIYGIGHAVYTLSDPRAELLKEAVRQLAVEKDCLEEFDLYDRVEKMAPRVLKEVRGIDRALCANVDFYSGFLYDMLGIPVELFTPIFAMSRVSGWCAHRMEELKADKIIRPAFKNVARHTAYVPLSERAGKD